MIKKGSLVLYKNKPAIVEEMGKKIEVRLIDERRINVREKDVTLLHPGPVVNFNDLNISQKECDKIGTRLLDSVGLKDYLHCFPSHLSGGQNQRVSIARALSRSPSLILADEPTASLDKKTGHDCAELLKNLAKEKKTAILLVTHDSRILDIADRVISLEEGRIQ